MAAVTIYSDLGFNSMWTESFQVFKLDLEKAEEPDTGTNILVVGEKYTKLNPYQLKSLVY